jgi:hypothetical protein
MADLEPRPIEDLIERWRHLSDQATRPGRLAPRLTVDPPSAGERADLVTDGASASPEIVSLYRALRDAKRYAGPRLLCECPGAPATERPESETA